MKLFGYSEKDVQWLLSAKDQVINTLDRQIHFLAAELTRERQRAELAIDKLLLAKGVSSVMPEVVNLPTPEERAAAVKQAKEFDQVRVALESVGDIGTDPDLNVSVKEEIVV